MAYRQKTGDYVINGKVFDLYDTTTRKADISEIKKRAKKKYKYVRVLRRNNEYQIWVK